MPVRIGTPGAWQTIRPTSAWQVMPAPFGRDDLDVATDLYYVMVSKRSGWGTRPQKGLAARTASIRSNGISSSSMCAAGHIAGDELLATR
jgi:hypothetical protein